MNQHKSNSGKLIKACCVCGKWYDEEKQTWYVPINNSEHNITHSYCDPCFEKALEKVRADIQELQRYKLRYI